MDEYATIKLTNFDINAMIDQEDIDRVKGYKWRMDHRGYVIRSVWEDNKPKIKYLHRDIMDAQKGFDVDHIDHNRLNNRKSNLRIATRSENMMNTRKGKKVGGLSKYKGVSRLNRPNLKNQWNAYIKVNYQMINIGYFHTQEEAAYMYNCYAEQLFGEFASLNDIVVD